MRIENWYGCYNQTWNGWIVPAAFAHPAKASRALVTRIFSELRRRGDLVDRSLVVDPFGGIGTTAIVGAFAGLRVEKRRYRATLDAEFDGRRDLARRFMTGFFCAAFFYVVVRLAYLAGRSFVGA